MLQKIKYEFYRFMSGRYGYDQLNLALLISSVLISLIAGFFFGRHWVVSLIIYVLSLIILWRSFSRKIYKRQKENLQFMQLIRPFKSKYKVIKLNLREKKYKHIQCPRCKRTLRVPRGRGKIEITCPHCHISFDKRS